MSLFFRDEGPRIGLPIVLIHGFALDHTMWQPQVQALKNHFRVVTYDVRGLGRSPLADARATMESYVDDLFGLLELLGLPAAALCGLSMGGYIALRAVQREPARIRALVLADTRSEADTEPARQNRIAAIRGIEQHGLKPFADEFMKKLFAPQTLSQNRPCVAATLSAILSNDPKGVCAAAAAIMSRTDTTSALARIAVPALVLTGADDSLTPPALGRALAAAIPGARFSLIPGAGHLSNLENPAAFNQHLLEFLRSLPD